MVKFIFSLITVLFFTMPLQAQPPKSKDQIELERQRQEIKREIEQTQALLDKTKKSTKASLAELSIIQRKLDLQNNVIENINKDINLLDNNINRSQRDAHKLSLLLDTLKQEYAKSMVYAYKNRSNSDFLNFIFSSSSFNDAIKRITYLKTYRTFREMQGDNILRTQGLLKERISELSDTKLKKNIALENQNKEKVILANQEEEKNQVVKKLKAQSKELNNHIAASKKQMSKVSAAITAAIKRARDEAIARAKIEAAEKAKRDAAERDKLANANKASGNPTVKVVPVKTRPAPVKQESVLLATVGDVTLNTNFENNRGSLPWPVDKGYKLMSFGINDLPGNIKMDNPGITIGSDIGTAVKAIFDGEVSAVQSIEDMVIVVIKHGRYFSTYSNLHGVNLTRGQKVRTGQVIGKVSSNDEGIGSIDLIISNERSNMNPESWLRHR
jgi:murein hydrolase activator